MPTGTGRYPFRLDASSGEAIQLPRYKDIDRPLIAGSLLFGIGRDLAGICPGPGLVIVGYGSTKDIAFVGALCVAMFLFSRVATTSKRAVVPRSAKGTLPTCEADIQTVLHRGPN